MLCLTHPPTHPPTHIRKFFLRRKIKFIKGARNRRYFRYTDFFFSLLTTPNPISVKFATEPRAAASPLAP